MADRLILENVTVDFPIYDVNARSLRHRLVLNRLSDLVAPRRGNVGGSLREDGHGVVIVRALESVSLTLSDGDRVALIGHNGAGKTTLLRVAAGIYEPAAGTVATHGRVMPVFNMMEGVAPDVTGIEMIKVRGVLLGLSNDEIEERILDIAEFCEIGEYINVPIRTYSSGMLVRLAFAITTAIPCEILIMDEFIGAGDAAFVERAQARLKGFVGQARALLVATHSPSVALEWCNKGVLLQQGRIVDTGPMAQILDAYGRASKGDGA